MLADDAHLPLPEPAVFVTTFQMLSPKQEQEHEVQLLSEVVGHKGVDWTEYASPTWPRTGKSTAIASIHILLILIYTIISVMAISKPRSQCEQSQRGGFHLTS